MLEKHHDVLILTPNTLSPQKDVLTMSEYCLLLPESTDFSLRRSDEEYADSYKLLLLLRVFLMATSH